MGGGDGFGDLRDRSAAVSVQRCPKNVYRVGLIKGKQRETLIFSKSRVSLTLISSLSTKIVTLISSLSMKQVLQ